MSRLYRDSQIDLLSWSASTVLHDVKQQIEKQRLADHESDIRQALRYSSATSYLRDYENAV